MSTESPLTLRKELREIVTVLAKLKGLPPIRLEPGSRASRAKLTPRSYVKINNNKNVIEANFVKCL